MDVNLNIEDMDIEVILSFLKGKEAPQELDELVYHIALVKTRHLRKNRVKIYDPGCEYREGDLIFKEYSGKLPTGAKRFIEMDRGIVLKVAEVRQRMGRQEIRLEYDGTSDFRKYTEYLDRQKIELLLPHKQGRPVHKTCYLEEDQDPRQQQQPLVERDLGRLRKKVVSALNRIAGVAFISGKLLLEENLKKIADDVFDRIREFLRENKKSESTEFLVENFVKIKPKDPEFPAYCFALNHRMMKDFKIDFHQTSMAGWGRWNLISVIYHLKKDALISMPNPLAREVHLANRKGLTLLRRKLNTELFPEPNRFYLTQREVTSGALRVKPGAFHFGESIELNAVEAGSKKELTLYYYADDQLIMGFKDYFESIRALQALNLTLEQIGEDRFQFEVRTTKKGTVTDRVEYDPEKETFRVTEEKVASPVFANKIMFLEPEVFRILHEHVGDFREADSMNDLVQRVFLVFGLRERNYEIHALRLYHILDLIYPVRLRTVLDILLANPEFVPSEKVPGVFYLDSDSIDVPAAEERERILEAHEEEIEAEIEAEAEESVMAEPVTAAVAEGDTGVESADSHEEEIRRLREERRRRREEEMRLKEERMRRIRIEKLGERLQAVEVPPVVVVEAESEAESVRRRRKVEEEEKTPKPKKRVEKPPVVDEETLDMDEIKEEIQLEKLKEAVLEKKSLETPREKQEVAYKDDGGFGGILASKLDRLSDKEKKESKKSTKKKGGADS
ncbi:MAG: hypothetical protein RB296_07610 [Acidobacteriota bacterium]|nr:hypothetical protein [Acidobacteriota bacterium]